MMFSKTEFLVATPKTIKTQNQASYSENKLKKIKKAPAFYYKKIVVFYK